MNERALEERIRRQSIWSRLEARGGPNGVTPSLVRELSIHRGQQGVFRDLAVTSSISDPEAGVAVGVLYTGRVYDDDVASDGLIYHVPMTSRGVRDKNEVTAIDSCRFLSLPLFVVTKSHRRALLRDVHLGWVADFDPVAGQFLILFGEAAPPDVDDAGEQDSFQLQVERKAIQSLRKGRPNQAAFRFSVLKRYGTTCALCGISDKRLIDAAHLCGVEENGCDDPRNGLPLCLNHHQSIDKGLVAIDPETLAILPVAADTSLELVGVTRTSIAHLSNLPHREALRWLWNRKRKTRAA